MSRVFDSDSREEVSKESYSIDKLLAENELIIDCITYHLSHGHVDTAMVMQQTLERNIAYLASVKTMHAIEDNKRGE